MKWGDDCAPPEVEGHTNIKLNLLRSYLHAYFDRLSQTRRDIFRLTLVDGFAGGGNFTHEGNIISGSPLVMLEEGKDADHRLNVDRKNKIKFEIKYRFVEKVQQHYHCLKKALTDSGYVVDDDKISVQNRVFEDVAEDIIDKIKADQPKAGRSIFLLDQAGYKHVTLDLIRKILDKLPQSEILLTYAMDYLLNFLRDDGRELLEACKPMELTTDRLIEIIKIKNNDIYGGKALAQRLILRHFMRQLEPRPLYITPFILTPKSSRSLWFIHFSRHPTARNVMVGKHWEQAGYCGHYGPGSLGILGYDSFVSGSPELFEFTDLELPNIKSELKNQLPETLYNWAYDNPITVDAFHRLIANDTAAKFETIDETVGMLHREEVVSIHNSSGKKRSRSLKILKPTDIITIPNTLIFDLLYRGKAKKK